MQVAVAVDPRRNSKVVSEGDQQRTRLRDPLSHLLHYAQQSIRSQDIREESHQQERVPRLDPDGSAVQIPDQR